MSKSSRLHHVTQDYRARLKAREAQAEQQLEQAYAHVMKTLEPALNHLYDQMVEKMASGEKIPMHWLVEAERLESIKKLIENQINHFGSFSQAQVLQAQHFATQLGQESAQEMLRATVPPGISWHFGIPSQAAIAELVGATQAGSPLADLFQGFGREAADGAAKALIRGVTLGINPRQIARDVQRELGTSRARALTISRTEMIRCYRSAALENYRANDDVCSGWIWMCSLLPKSCAACVAMHGTRHSLEEELNDHPNGSCAPVPETKPWADILGPLGIDTSGIEETGIELESGSAWLDKQGESVQRAILGAKYDGWSNGDFSLSDVVGYDHDKDWGSSIKEKPLKDLVNA